MAKSGSTKIRPPKGTRDLYPEDLLRQRYITEAWRRVSIRHGFDEIAGPTFEMLDLYKKKSGEGIVSELFSFTRAGGDDHYALRPEFTPTLARMYAEKAKELPVPCKWFTAGPYFRAEKPQRGRLREFMQWNCDVMGGEENGNDPLVTQYSRNQYDADTISVVVELLNWLGLNEKIIRIKLASRYSLRHFTMPRYGIDSSDDKFFEDFFTLLDDTNKISAEEFKFRARALKNGEAWLPQFGPENSYIIRPHDTLESFKARHPGVSFDDEESFSLGLEAYTKQANIDGSLQFQMEQRGLNNWVEFDSSIVRGLAYYTGTVFELIADGERAVAGGGRYDNLIELFGGPPTPAVGFGMGDVVLGLLLEDKGLMPEGPDLADAVSQKPASIRPEAFVIANEEGEAHIEPLLAELRRGKETEGFEGKPWDVDRYEVAPMHARRSYKSTKNIGKLLADARKQHAKFAIIIENDSEAKIENLITREEVGTFALDQIGAQLVEHL